MKVELGDTTAIAGDGVESILRRVEEICAEMTNAVAGWVHWRLAAAASSSKEGNELDMFAIIGIVVVFGCVVAGYLDGARKS